MENEDKASGGKAQDKNELLRRILRQMQGNLKTALDLLEDGAPASRIVPLLTMPEPKTPAGGRTVEGSFDGQRMVGDDGETYPVPQNYASKSKLVSGDRLKLIITSSGNFIFKQVGPTERDRQIGTLAMDPATRQYVVTVGDKRWKVLTASVTYFRGEPGEETVILIPKDRPSAWAAVENIVHKTVGLANRGEK